MMKRMLMALMLMSVTVYNCYGALQWYGSSDAGSSYHGLVTFDGQVIHLSAGGNVSLVVEGAGTLSFKARGSSDGFYYAEKDVVTCGYIRNTEDFKEYSTVVSESGEHCFGWYTYAKGYIVANAWGEIFDVKWNGVPVKYSSLVDGLVAYYECDGNLKDVSGNQYDLNVSGTTAYVEDRYGKVGSAFMLDGSSCLYEPSSSEHCWSTNYTFACWFKAIGETCLCDVAQSGIYGTSSSIKYLCGHSTLPIAVGTNGINVFEHGEYYLPAIFKYEKDLGAEWHHLALTLSNQIDIVIYLDGTQIGNVTKRKLQYGAYLGLGGYDAISSDHRYLGIGSFGYGGHFYGGIDEVRFYNRAISAGEVKVLFNGVSQNILYVNGSIGSDENLGLTEQSPKATIQAALDVATDGATILVADGIYDPITVGGWRGITIRSRNGAQTTIIDGGNVKTVANLWDDEAQSGSNFNHLVGFTLQNGYVAGRFVAGAFCGGLAVNCIFRNNYASGYGSGVVLGGDLINCIMYGNTFDSSSGGISCNSRLYNCTLYGNNASYGLWDCDVYNSISYSSGCEYRSYDRNQYYHSLTWNGWDVDLGNITGDPLFKDALNTELQLVRSSPCVDAGNMACYDTWVQDRGYSIPSEYFETDISGNPRVNGAQVDMGALEYIHRDYRVIFDVQGGEVCTNILFVTNGESIGELPKTKKNGHKFLGWFTTAEGGEKVTRETIITNDVTFYAHWRDLSKEILVAHYEFDGDAKDASGNGHDGEVKGATLTADRFGNENRAYLFSDGKYISVPNDPQLAGIQSNVTISAWIRPTSWVNNYWITLLCKGSVNPRNLSFILRRDKTAFETANGDFVSLSGLPSLNRWQHLAYTSDGEEVKIYLDGKLIGSIAQTLCAQSNTEPLSIGRDEVGVVEYFQGAMDDIRIYNYALTEEEIQDVYHENDVAEFLFTQYTFTSQPKTLSTAESYLNNSSNMSGEFVTEGYRTIAFEKGDSGLLAFPAVPFPGQGIIGDESFALIGHARVFIPEAGVWTFACGSDDGFRLQISSTSYSDSMQYTETRSYAITMKQFSVPTAGYYELDIFHYEWGGGASCELSVAKGAYSSFDSSVFKLVGTEESGITLVGKVLDYVTFDAQGGTNETDLVKVEQGQAIGALPMVTRKPYQFLGWFTESSGGERVTAETVITNDITFYAHWQEPTVGDVMGVTNALWRVGGAADWRIEETNGNWSVRSGVIGKSSESWIECVVTNGCRVAYDWKVSSEPGEDDEMYDFLSLTVDGEQVDAICGESGWTNGVAFVEGEGEHVLRWTYQKDNRTTEGEDCGWLGAVTIDPEARVTFDANGATSGDVPTIGRVYRGDEIRLPGTGSLAKVCHTFGGWGCAGESFAEGDPYVIERTETSFVVVWHAKVLGTVELLTPVDAVVTTETINVSFAMPTNATMVRYTLDGSEPTDESTVYEGPFAVTNRSVVVKAIACADDWFSGACTSWSLARAPWTAAECLNVETRCFAVDGDATWFRDLETTHDGVAAWRSGVIGNKQSTELQMTVTGSGTVSFWCRVSSECDEEDGEVYDGLSVEVDGRDALGGMLGGEIGWTNICITVTGSGEHVVSWRYEKDRTGSAGEDGAWLDEILWQADEVVVLARETGSKDIAISRSWIEQELVIRYGSDRTAMFRQLFGTDYEQAVRKSTGKAVNGKPGVVWQDYVAGTDPTDTNSVFSASIQLVNGLPDVTWLPDLGKVRTYTIWGRKELNDAEGWTSPTNSFQRFFKVTVDMP